MGKVWSDLGSGRWKLTVTGDNANVPVSVYRGTRDEILDQLADSQANANKRIYELRGTGNGAVVPIPSAGAAPQVPGPLSPAERLQTVAELTNPATVDKAVTRVIESVVGPVQEFRQDRQADREERETRSAVSAAETFARQTPDWYPSDYNKGVLVNFMRTQGLSPTNPQHYTQAFESLSAAQLLQARPEAQTTTIEPPAEEGRNAPTPTPKPTAPTRFSTSIRSSDISGSAPGPKTTPRLKYTREQLRNISASEYKRLMQTDRAELERCEDYYVKNPLRRAG